MQIQVRVEQVGFSTSEGTVRDHTIVMDRPEDKGGENRGPMGGETFLMALGGCFMSNLLAAAAARDSDVADIALDIAGTMGTAPPRFTAVEMKITAAHGQKEEMEKLVTIAERGCLIANTLKNALDLTIVLG